MSRGLLTVLASGAVLGPAAGGFLMQQFGARAIFLELAAAGAVLTVFAMCARGLPRPLRSAYVAVPVSTLGASELDPRRTAARNGAPRAPPSRRPDREVL